MHFYMDSLFIYMNVGVVNLCSHFANVHNVIGCTRFIIGKKMPVKSFGGQRMPKERNLRNLTLCQK